ncbi:L,D-transpeptidase family protein [bacterium]|nr:L,D-transpeptidase family protein [bacterium]
MKKFGVTVITILLICAVIAVPCWLKKRNNTRSFQSAMDCYAAGDVSAAQQMFGQLKDKSLFNPHKQESLYYYSLIIGTDDPEQAKPLWEKLFAKDVPAEWKAALLFNLGRYEFQKEQYKDAADTFDRVITEYSSCLEPYAQSMFYLGEIDYRQGLYNYLDARKWYKKVMEVGLNHPVTNQAVDRLSEVNIALLFSPVPTEESKAYTIHPGDSLAVIAQRHKTSVELIKESNRMKTNFIRPNDQIKVPTVTFSIEINKTTNELILNADGAFFKRYRVGTGKFNKTPVGTFRITNKLAEPIWYRPDGGVIPYGDPENLLGTRWMGINFPGYGIHGTWDEQSIGFQSSAGCVRLLNTEIEELFKIVPVGTEVVITESKVGAL